MRRPDLLAFKLARVFVAHLIEPHEVTPLEERADEIESIAHHLETAAAILREKVAEQRAPQRSNVQ